MQKPNRTLLRKIKSIFLFFYSFIVCSSLAVAESNLTFPTLKEKELPYYFNKQEKTADPNIYLFSSLSFISTEKNSIEFGLTKAKYGKLIPLSAVNAYPAIDYYIKSEYFDFTLWGQLGNYFNKNIEIVELENRIFSILQELEEINNRYKSLFADKPDQLHSEYIPTINKKNYFHEHKGEENGEEQKGDSGISQADNNLSELDTLLNNIVLSTKSNKFEKALLLSEIALNLEIKGLRANQNMTYKSESAVKNVSSQETQTGGNKSSSLESETWIISLFNKSISLFAYLVNNKIEALIYLVFLFLVIAIVTRIFTQR
ncbi:MAG: hypothetical protein MRK01_00020 [Candidatus Scalindua sp.]|nr:hypothetical protein [Candidatus Scalindua sp.]